jgi:hypothetical protein
MPDRWWVSRAGGGFEIAIKILANYSMKMWANGIKA